MKENILIKLPNGNYVRSDQITSIKARDVQTLSDGTTRNPRVFVTHGSDGQEIIECNSIEEACNLVDMIANQV